MPGVVVVSCNKSVAECFEEISLLKRLKDIVLDSILIIIAVSAWIFSLEFVQSLDMPGSPEHVEVSRWRSTELFYNSSFIFSVECG
uniref:Uncharacterized protein n=1 Tax=Vespula pensylvanica TaxID=30213 RepID=A0A834U4C0_VESPE|nr:hypothetical protein H0235_011025 [Vespula pensylvanica]